MSVTAGISAEGKGRMSVGTTPWDTDTTAVKVALPMTVSPMATVVSTSGKTVATGKPLDKIVVNPEGLREIVCVRAPVSTGAGRRLVGMIPAGSEVIKVTGTPSIALVTTPRGVEPTGAGSNVAMAVPPEVIVVKAGTPETGSSPSLTGPSFSGMRLVGRMPGASDVMVVSVMLPTTLVPMATGAPPEGPGRSVAIGLPPEMIVVKPAGSRDIVCDGRLDGRRVVGKTVTGPIVGVARGSDGTPTPAGKDVITVIAGRLSMTVVPTARTEDPNVGIRVKTGVPFETIVVSSTGLMEVIVSVGTTGAVV
jgi:hypothetical protein